MNTTAIDLNQPRITITGDDCYPKLLDLLDKHILDQSDGACVALIGATHVAEFELLSTTLGPRYIVTHRELLQMTHYPEDISAVGFKWVSTSAFKDIEEAKQYYGELVMGGAQAWVDSFDQ